MASHASAKPSLERFARLGVLKGLVEHIPDGFVHPEEFRELSAIYLDADIERVSRPTLRAIFGLVLRPRAGGEK